MVFVIQIILQILDGILTNIGLSIYGINAEGNPLLWYLMNLIGSYTIALILVKGFIILLTLYTWYIWSKCSEYKKMLFYVNIFYIFLAIIPWTVLIWKSN